MLTNVVGIEELTGLARARARSYETRTVNPALVEQFVTEGWTVDKRNKRSVRLRRSKLHNALLEDRVWMLFYRMRFPLLSGVGGAKLAVELKNPESPTTQIDVAVLDNEVAVAIECKSCEALSKRPQFQHDLGKHALVRERFTAAARSQFASSHKRQIVLAIFTFNILLNDNDRTLAKDANVVLFDEHDLEYYEALVSHIGPAARYQLLADTLPGKTIPGLEIRVPAIKTKMGGFNCYSFSITPDYLLKISYISHRSKGKRSDVSTYQRMLNKGRLHKIRQYITEDGIFPTNIVVNIDKNKLQFERMQQEGDAEAGVAGWLTIRPSYKSAWIIDGQHRLISYSGHERAMKSRLSVLAFDGLEPSEQARLFIDINAKQKSVKQSLLQELYAELHWNADDPAVRSRAIISKAIQDLDADPESPLYQRVLTADVAKDPIRCISLTSLYGAIERAGFHISREKKGHVLEFGPLWRGDNDATLKRTEYVLKNWLGTVRIGASDWWDKGAGEGGGLAMNDGVITCINVLRSVLLHLEGKKLIRLDDEDIFEVLKKYAAELGSYFGRFTEQERKAFRDVGRGIQGQTRRSRYAQQGLRQVFAEFNPPGLDQFIEQETAQTNTRAGEVIRRIEATLQKVVLEELRREFGEDEADWWMRGVPKSVRLKVSERFEDDGGKRGSRESYFDLVDYAKIAGDNFRLFEPILAYETGNKEKRLSWLNFVNEKRKIAMHASAGVNLSSEDLLQLEEYDQWLANRIAPSLSGDS
jgi:DGQHR domain-containing protein